MRRLWHLFSCFGTNRSLLTCRRGATPSPLVTGVTVLSLTGASVGVGYGGAVDSWRCDLAAKGCEVSFDFEPSAGAPQVGPEPFFNVRNVTSNVDEAALLLPKEARVTPPLLDSVRLAFDVNSPEAQRILKEILERRSAAARAAQSATTWAKARQLLTTFGRGAILAVPYMLSGGKDPFPLAGWDGGWRAKNPDVYPGWKFHASAPDRNGVIHVSAWRKGPPEQRLSVELTGDGTAFYTPSGELAMVLDEGYAAFFNPDIAFPQLIELDRVPHEPHLGVGTPDEIPSPGTGTGVDTDSDREPELPQLLVVKPMNTHWHYNSDSGWWEERDEKGNVWSWSRDDPRQPGGTRILNAGFKPTRYAFPGPDGLLYPVRRDGTRLSLGGRGDDPIPAAVAQAFIERLQEFVGWRLQIDARQGFPAPADGSTSVWKELSWEHIPGETAQMLRGVDATGRVHLLGYRVPPGADSPSLTKAPKGPILGEPIVVDVDGVLATLFVPEDSVADFQSAVEGGQPWHIALAATYADILGARSGSPVSLFSRMAGMPTVFGPNNEWRLTEASPEDARGIVVFEHKDGPLVVIEQKNDALEIHLEKDAERLLGAFAEELFGGSLDALRGDNSPVRLYVDPTADYVTRSSAMDGGELLRQRILAEQKRRRDRVQLSLSFEQLVQRYGYSLVEVGQGELYSTEQPTLEARLRRHFARVPDLAMERNLLSAVENKTPFGRALAAAGYRRSATGGLIIPERERADAGLDEVGPALLRRVVLGRKADGSLVEISAGNRSVAVPIMSQVSDYEFVSRYMDGELVTGPHDDRGTAYTVATDLHDWVHDYVTRADPELSAEVIAALKRAAALPADHALLRDNIYNLLEHAIVVDAGAKAALLAWAPFLNGYDGRVVTQYDVAAHLDRVSEPDLTALARLVTQQAPHLIQAFGAGAADEVWIGESSRYERRLFVALRDGASVDQIKTLLAASLAELHNWSLIPREGFADAFVAPDRDQELLKQIFVHTSAVDPMSKNYQDPVGVTHPAPPVPEGLPPRSDWALRRSDAGGALVWTNSQTGSRFVVPDSELTATLAGDFAASFPDADYGVDGPPYVMKVAESWLEPEAELKAHRRPGVHIGTAGLANLDMVGSEGAILFDINSQQTKFWRVFEEQLKVTTDRREFPRALLAAQLGQDTIGHSMPPEEAAALHAELNRNGGWMSTDEGYAAVRKLALEGKLIFTTTSIQDTRRWGEIGAWLGDQNLPVSTFYVSNLRNFATRGIPGGIDGFYQEGLHGADIVAAIEAVAGFRRDGLIVIDGGGGEMALRPYDAFKTSIDDELGE